MNTRQSIEANYDTVLHWAVSRLGQDGQDCVHDAVVMLLTQSYDKDSRTEFIGLWRLLAQKAFAELRAVQSGRCSYHDGISNEHVLTAPDAIRDARKVVQGMLHHIPFAGRRVVFRLYVVGESLIECSKSLGLTVTQVRYIRTRTIQQLGEAVRLEREI